MKIDAENWGTIHSAITLLDQQFSSVDELEDALAEVAGALEFAGVCSKIHRPSLEMMLSELGLTEAATTIKYIQDEIEGASSLDDGEDFVDDIADELGAVHSDLLEWLESEREDGAETAETDDAETDDAETDDAETDDVERGPAQ